MNGIQIKPGLRSKNVCHQKKHFHMFNQVIARDIGNLQLSTNIE